MSDPLPTTSTVHYSLTAGSASAGSDFTPVGNRTLSFGANVVRRVISVRVLADTLVEGDESFAVTLFDPSGGPALLRAEGTGTILEDDPTTGVVVGVGDVSVVEGDSGPASGTQSTDPTIVEFAVTLNKRTPMPVSVQYSTVDETASAGADHTASPTRTLRFLPGEYKKYVTVAIARDTTAELDETFALVLSNPTRATLGRARATGTILNDDTPTTPTITATHPVSPGSSTTPSVIGTSDPDTTVELFFDPTCSGPPEASGSAGSFASPGIAVSVPADTTTTIHARATLGASSSPCSPGIDYLHESPAPPPPPPPPPAGSGTLWGWGYNYSGQVGDGTTTDQTSPVQVGTDADWVMVSSGRLHSCGIRTDATLWCWGDNDYGQLGDGTTTNRYSPTQVGTDTDWATVAAGAFHSCATRTDATLWCWGDNTYGQVGDGTATNRSSPVQVGTDTDWAMISAGSYHNLAIRG